MELKKRDGEKKKLEGNESQKKRQKNSELEKWS